MNLLNHPIIAERYFFPRSASLKDAIEVEVNGAQLGCFVRRVPHATKTLVHFHGNGEVVGDYLGDWIDTVASFGVNVFLAEYRGYGASTGTPLLGELLSDVEVLLDRAQQETECDSLAVYGRSVGSIFAAHAVSVRSVDQLILESGISDVGQRLLLRMTPQELGTDIDAFRQAIADQVDQQQKLRQYDGSTLIMHCRDDSLVRFIHAQDNAIASSGKLVAFERGGHNAIMSHNWDAYIAALAEFLG